MSNSSVVAPGCACGRLRIATAKMYKYNSTTRAPTERLLLNTGSARWSPLEFRRNTCRSFAGRINFPIPDEAWRAHRSCPARLRRRVADRAFPLLIKLSCGDRPLIGGPNQHLLCSGGLYVTPSSSKIFLSLFPSTNSPSVSFVPWGPRNTFLNRPC